ncbi:ribbon-helix-helix protein, CopG family [Nocardioides agariphilus]|uniref:Ribbon-helix-helix protein, CopG family n=1 Tax=Nocardioides agariphilus TaxID=433664 RepID=A0A930VN71_9ACTN|nr:ribbon-helix-helix protein, CopG family [Nocardioides agariphilus]MBF4767903.1 ribbon-helix-helix protein, CopG family [Nocardioides agariphilus]
MRMHIELDDTLVEELDAVTGPRGRSAFVRVAIERALEQEKRWRALDEAAGALAESEHDWDGDTAGWVRGQRRGDRRRAG